MTETLHTPVRELTTGSTFAGRYQVIEELGHGGMGRVYKVFDTKIKEKIALKLINPEIASDKETIERFGNELRLARKISQRNVCRMFDIGAADGAHFITMEYVHGEDLKSMIHIFHEDSPDKYSESQTVKTEVGAKTMALDPKTHNLFLTTSDFGPPPVPTSDRPHPNPVAIPGTFRLLVYGR